MFTGIVEEVGRLVAVTPTATGVRLVVGATTVLEGTRIGDSIAISGCCLTVVELGDGTWAADAVPETLSRTTLGDLVPGDPVNLERAVAAGDRLGGHLVQGHVDGVGRVVTSAPDLTVSVPPGVAPYLVAKGSVTVAGVSLTVVDIDGDTFGVAVIPHTAAVTTIGALRPDDRVNLEADVIAKYVGRLLAAGASSPYTDLTRSAP